MLAAALDYGELAARAVPLPALGRNAHAIAPVHALLLACIHRAGHANAPYHVDGIASPEGDRLIWLYDIHLLVGGMSAGELDEFVALADVQEDPGDLRRSAAADPRMLRHADSGAGHRLR